MAAGLALTSVIARTLDKMSQNVQFAKVHPLILAAFRGFHTPNIRQKDERCQRRRQTPRQPQSRKAHRQPPRDNTVDTDVIPAGIHARLSLPLALWVNANPLPADLCRYPEHRDVNVRAGLEPAPTPWHLGSGNPCRYDDILCTD